MSHKSGSKYKPGAQKPRSLKARAEREKAIKTWAAKSKFKAEQDAKAAKSSPKKKAPSSDAAMAEATPGRQQQRDASEAGGLKVRVKTANARKLSSTLWLQRQLNDPYVQKAKREGFRSRAAYKFLEIDDRYHLLKAGQRIVDLGCAPGGWAQIAADRTGAANGRAGAMVVGIDLLDVEPIAGVTFEKLDFTAGDAPDRLKAMLGGDADGVLSDMAANTIGHKRTDHLRIIALAEMAIAFARDVLAPGGFFLAKVFQGGTENDLLTDLKRDFAAVRHVKPKASRQDSAELYVLATGFRGG